MGRARTICRLLLVAGLALVAGILPGVVSAPARAAVAHHQAAKTKAKPKPKKPVRCRATRRHRCPRRPVRPPAPIRPAVSTGQPQGITSGAATLTATVSIRKRTATTYWFQYGATAAYGSETGAQPTRVGNRVTVSTSVGGLGAGGTYHYRVVASSCNGCAKGTAYGADVTFIAGGYTDPVFSTAAAADPFVLDNNGAHHDYWAFVTGNLFPVLHSSDLVHWTSMGTAMSQLPSWVIPQGDWHPWGPSVTQTPGPCPGTGSTSCYVLYYSGTSAAFNNICVAVATSTTPQGPYTDQGPLSDGTTDASGRPIGCGDNAGFGEIDPSPFRDSNGQSYLYVSTGNACAPSAASCTRTNSYWQPTISVIPLSSDGLHATGPRTPLFHGDAGTWENVGAGVPVVEGPAMVLHNGTYYLFYSGGAYWNAYGMGYATGSSPLGPFSKSPANPILSQTPTVFSPGGADLPVTGPHGGSWLVYHGREGSYSAPRLLRIEPLSWRGQAYGPDAPVVGQPTDAPQGFAP
jgi:hypothetical protein